MLNIKNDYEVVLNAIDGLMVLNEKAEIIFASDDVAKEEGFGCGAELIGKSVRDLIPTNKAYKVLETGEKQYSEVYLVEGLTIISNAFPLYKDGKIAGVVEYDIFNNTTTLHHFLDQVAALSNELEYYKNEIRVMRGAKYSIDNIAGESVQTKELKTQIAYAARSNSTVLIGGETGVGKELVAHSIHRMSNRSLRNFIKVNCAAIPSELFESEFFGYEEGGFTGAKRGGKKGLIEMANGGTLFLDEVSELPVSMQAKLLRVLQEREFMRVGGEKVISVDVRIIAASNENLWNLVKEKKFREDLFYRLNVLEIKIQPLRMRKEDIPYIAKDLIKSLNASLGRSGPSHYVSEIDPSAMSLLMRYEWPGNVRELSNLLERAMNKCYGNILKPEHFDELILESTYQAATEEIGEESGLNLQEAKKRVEIHMIKLALEKSSGSHTKAAELLGISRQMLNRKIKQYDL